jgi:outer membrane protein assembly factor BamB/WD40 repeat protein
MLSIGRIPVLKYHLLIWCATCLMLASASAVNAQPAQPPAKSPPASSIKSPAEPGTIAVPLATTKRAARAIDTRWIAPPGYVTDRQLVMRLTRFQAAALGPWAEDFNWNEVLQDAHAGILAAPEDTLIIAMPAGVNADTLRLPYGVSLPPLRSLKGVAEEIIADLPQVGRDAWLRVISDRANAEYSEAVRTDDWATINRIASQDVHTPAGYAAVDLLGNRHLDQNRPLAAIRQFYRLLKSAAARESREPSLSIRTAVSWNNLGRPDQARLALIDLSQWLSRHPDVAARLPGDFIADTTAWLQNNQLSATAAGDTNAAGDTEIGNRFASAGLLPRASESAFSPDARVLWKSQTSGFNASVTDSVTDENRKKFLRRFDDEDFNAEDPFPESETETAALVEVGLAHLTRRDHRRKTKALPASEPVIANGQTVFRTLNRIRSVDLKTGSLRWESFITDSAFAEQFDLQQADRSVNIPQESNDISNPLNSRQSAVVYVRSRLDRTSGTLSTNGSVLFALEEGGISAKATAYRQAGVVQTAPRSWNRLCGFDLKSGFLRWQIGGPEGEHELPAAGTFFLGVPTVSDDSIYVLGEQSGLVRLLCLEPVTGKVKWTQPVATASAAITQEGLRRIGGISPRIAEGLIICPTVSGLIVAFDPELQRLAWTSNYRTTIAARSIPPRGMFRGPVPVNMFHVDSLERWRHDATFVTAGQIVMSPLDSQELLCLAAVSGDTMWSQPRGQGLFVGAAFGNQVIVVDDSAVRSLSLKDGSLNWAVQLNQRSPTGRGLRIGPLFHLPVAVVVDDEATTNDEVGDDPVSDQSLEQSGRLVTIDLRFGRLLAESRTPDGQPLGNLVAHEGQLLAQRFDSVVAMESLAVVESNLTKQLEEKPGDSSVLESRARIRLHEGRLKEGLHDLQLAVQDRNAKTALNLLVEQSLEQLRQGQELVDEMRQVLADADLSAVQRNALDAVRVDRLLAAGEPVAAFDVLLDSPRIDTETGEPFMVYADPLAISSNAWIAAQLQAAYEQASSRRPGLGHVASLDERVRERLKQAKAAAGPVALREWLNAFSWHTLFAEAAVALTERLDVKKDTLEIDSLLTRLSLHSDATVAASASERLSKPDVAVAWPQNAPQVATSSHNLSADRRVLVDVSGHQSAAIRGLEFELSLNGLTALSPSGKPLWTLNEEQLGSEPLLTTSRHNSSRIFSSGHLLAVLTGTEFSVFDIREPTPQRLWLKRFIGREAEGFFQMRQTHPLGNPVLISGNTPVGSVDFLTSHSLVYRTDSTLRVVNALSGRTIWTRDNIQADAIVFGDEFALSVVDARSAHCQLFDIRTGRLISEHFDIPLSGLLTSFGTDLIVRQNRGATHTISRIDMYSGKPTWEYDFPNSGSIRPASENRLVEFHPDGKILVREQSTGEVIIETQAEKQVVSGRFFLHETPTEYVLFSATPQRTFQSRIGALTLQGAPQNKVEGPAYGIDRQTGKLLWTAVVEPQFFAVKQPSQLPFVVLACWSNADRVSGQLPRSGRKYPIRVLDTRTGQTLFVTDGDTDEENVVNYLSTGDVDEKQASITFGKTVIHFDYSGKPQDAAPSQD